MLKFKLRNKKYITAICLLLFVMTIVVAPLKAARAVSLPPISIIGPPAIQGTGLLKEILGDVPARILKGAALNLLTGISYLFFKLAHLLFWLTNILFDKSIEIAIQTPDFFNKGIVPSGWAVVRDISNLFFILIMIFIGIATILQISAYGAKQLLVKIIIVALLINFSLPAAKMIIDASNILALQFLCAMTDNTCDATNLSASFAQAFSVQSLYGTSNLDEVKALFDEDAIKQLTSEFFLFIFGTVILTVAAFIILAGAFLFLIRTVALMILSIFSPFAFLGMILPRTANYAKQWWDKFINQAFLAPAFLFMLYLVVRFLLDPTNGLKALLHLGDQSYLSLVITDNEDSARDNIAILASFIIAIILLLASLAVARKLGGESAEKAIGAAHYVKNKAQGYVGRITRRAAGRPANWLASSQRRIARHIRNIPLFGGVIQRNAARVAAANRKKISQLAGNMQQFTNEELKNIAGSSTGFKRIAAIQVLAQRGDLKPNANLTSSAIKKAIADAKRYGLTIKEKSKEEIELEKAVRKIINEVGYEKDKDKKSSKEKGKKP
jgi:hypothetical protein